MEVIMALNDLKSKEERIFEAIHSGDYWRGKRQIVELIEGKPVASLNTPAQVNINAQDNDGNTFLHYLAFGTILIDEQASHSEHFAGDEYLIAKGADANILNNKGETPLKRLITSFSPTALSLDPKTFHTALIHATNKENLNKIYPDGETILTDYAAHNRDIGVNEYVISTLVKAGAHVNAPNVQYKTPLRVLLERMIDVNMRQGALFESRWQVLSRKENETAQLSLAAMQFIQAGAKLAPMDALALERNINTLKADSELANHGQIIEMFVDLAMDYDLQANMQPTFAADQLKNAHSRAALFHKWYYGKYESLINTLLADKFVPLLSHIDIKDCDGLTPLHHAVLANNQYLIDRLLQQNADIDAAANDGTTILHTAAKVGNVALIDTILTRGKTALNVPDNNGCTPLHFAADKEVFEKLVQAGADYSLKNNDGQMPVDLLKDLNTRVAYLSKMVDDLQSVVQSSPMLIAKSKKKTTRKGNQNQKD